MRVKAQKPFHSILENDLVVDVGDGDFYMLRDGQTAEEFDTKKDRALNPKVAAWELLNALPVMEEVVQSMKSPQAYFGKEYDARMLLSLSVDGDIAAGVYTAKKYPHLALEVEAQGCTPLEAANAIVMAVAREDAADMGTIATEQKRLMLREQIKSIKGSMTNA